MFLHREDMLTKTVLRTFQIKLFINSFKIAAKLGTKAHLHKLLVVYPFLSQIYSNDATNVVKKVFQEKIIFNDENSRFV